MSSSRGWPNEGAAKRHVEGSFGPLLDAMSRMRTMAYEELVKARIPDDSLTGIGGFNVHRNPTVRLATTPKILDDGHLQLTSTRSPDLLL